MTCPPWCLGVLHRSEPVEVVHGRQRMSLWLEHDEGDATPSVGLTATVVGVGAPAVVLSLAAAREVADWLRALILAAS